MNRVMYKKCTQKCTKNEQSNVQKMIRKVSFYIWENNRLTHKEEIVQVFGKETLFDKLKEKYGDDSAENVREYK